MKDFTVCPPYEFCLPAKLDEKKFFYVTRQHGMCGGRRQKLEENLG
ncbi:MAG: hypothetical protein ACTTKL_06020 [Treponema sp.]